MQQDVCSPRPIGRRSGWPRHVARLAKLGAAIIAAGAMARTAHGAPPIVPSTTFFPIGVYGQQADAFATWKARGVNTVVGFNTPGAWQDYWNDAAVSMGLWQIRNPRLNLAADVNQPYLLAWEYNDLPDVNKVLARTLAATYAQWKAADPSREVIVNLSAGSAISQTDGITDADYRLYTGTADLVSSEVFPVAALNQTSWIDKSLSSGSLVQNAGAGVDKLRTLSGGKRQYAYIETSDQDGAGPKRGPTADEVRGETWDAIVQGAKGIIYSPQASGSTDATPADVAASITLTDATITRYSAVLNTIADGQANTLDLPGGLEATWRDYHGLRYFFVLNDSHTAVKNASFSLTGLPASESVTLPDESRSLTETAGVLTDSFSPYQLHIYEGSTTGTGSSVPEPHGGAAVLGAIACLLRRRRKTV